MKKEVTNKPQKMKSKAEIEKIKPKVTLVEFTMSAVIPTVQYGNIQPSITVKADSIESAREVVAPIIEDLYNKYSEQVPRFLKPVIKEKEKIVPAEVITETIKVEPKPYVPNIATPDALKPEGHPVNATDVPFDNSKKNEAYSKTEHIIKTATSEPVLDIIEQKIKDSVKIAEEDKPELLKLVEGRRKLIEF